MKPSSQSNAICASRVGATSSRRREPRKLRDSHCLSSRDWRALLRMGDGAALLVRLPGGLIGDGLGLFPVAFDELVVTLSGDRHPFVGGRHCILAVLIFIA